MDPDSCTWLYFRILAEPNPAREDTRMWRMCELAARATALGRGRLHALNNVSSTVRTSLVKKRNFAHSVAGPKNCSLWCLTEQARALRRTFSSSTTR